MGACRKNGKTFDHHVLSNSGMSTFEQTFYPFIHHEIGSLAIASARLQMKQARKRLAEYIAEAKQSDEIKRKSCTSCNKSDNSLNE